MSEVIKEYVGRNNQPKETFNTRWWHENPTEQFRHLTETVSMLETRQSYRSQSNVKFARLYSNLESLGVYNTLYSPQVRGQFTPNKLTLNVVKSCIDTVTSKIAKAKPRPLFLTEGGDFNLKKKAQSLTQFLDGAFDAMGIYAEKQKTFRDSCIFGTGPLKFYKDPAKKMVCCERTVVEELLVDDAEGVYGKPGCLYQRRLVSRDVLKELYPKKFHSLIDQATNGIPTSFNSDKLSDLVKVIEAWHLPSAYGAGDGCHVIAIDTATLASEPWEHCYFPFVFDRWSERITGFFGSGLSEELLGIQLEINQILKNIQKSMHLFAVPRVWVENNAMVSQITNEIGVRNNFTGSPPIFQIPQAMSPDVYQHLWQLVQKAYEITGISQLSAMSKKPDGLNSGVALREYQDVESDRFQIVAQRYEESFLESARILIDMTKELSKEVKGLSVKVSDQGSMKIINWNDVDLDEERYIMRVFPTSILPTTPAGKLQTVTELVQANFLDKETATDLLDFPDLKSAMNLELAPRKIVFKILDRIVEKGVAIRPEPFMDLGLTQAVAEQYYLNALCQDVPEDRLELLRIFIKQTQELVDQAQAAMAPPPGAPGMDPTGAIGKPIQKPVNELMPVTNQPMPMEPGGAA